MPRTFAGGCHCGALRLEADIDLSAGTNECSCSICTRPRNWNANIKLSAVRLAAPLELGMSIAPQRCISLHPAPELKSPAGSSAAH